MKRLSVLLVSAGLALFAVGCGETSSPPTEADKQEMQSEMEKMTGGLPTTPGAGQPAGGAPAESKAE